MPIFLRIVISAVALLTLVDPGAGAASANPSHASEKGQWQLRAERHLHFEGDSAALNAAAEHDLRLIARAAQIHQDYFLSVVGYSGARDSASRKLAHQRVSAAIDFLERSGDVPAGRLVPGSGSSGDPAIVNVKVLSRIAHP